MMPATSPAQQHLMAMALAHKRGELPDASAEVRKIAGSMDERQLHDFAATKGLADGGIAGIGTPKPFHLMHGIGTPKLPAEHVMSPSQGTPWWTRSEAREMERPVGRGFADGGGLGHFQGGGGMSMSTDSPWWERSDARMMQDVPHGGGLISSSVAGRTDRLPLAVGTESHVLPADVVSGLGQGNTLAGARILTESLRTGPYGVPFPHESHGRGEPIPRPPPLPGGETAQLAKGGEGHKVSILAAGGEAVIPEDDWPARDEIDGKMYLHRGVRSIGEGDTKRGHERLDAMIAKVRAHTRQFLAHAPPPKKSIGGAVA